MKHYTPNKKPLNYFERQKQRLNTKKYRHFFLPDYFYYCGQRWSEQGARIGGMNVLVLYWGFCIMLPLYMNYSQLLRCLTDNERVLAGLALSIIPPIAFSLLRYRKQRRSALMNHYQRSAWCKGIPVWWVCLGWLPLWLVEVWLLKTYGG